MAPLGGAEGSRRYGGGDLVLETEFRAASGRLRLTDLMPIRGDGVSAVIRRLEVLDGTVEVGIVLSVRFGYGEMPPWFEPVADGFSGEVGPDLVMLRGPRLGRPTPAAASASRPR